MNESKHDSPTGLPDWADDLPEWTDEMLDTAEFSIGGKVIRPPTGYIGPNGWVRGRPPARKPAEDQ